LESDTFHGSFCAKIQIDKVLINLLCLSSCKDSYIRPFESNGFKVNLPRERRKDLYSCVYIIVVVPGIVPNNLFILIYEPMKAKINNQLKSESFQGLFCAQIQNKYMKSSCKESYIRPFESSGFKQNLPRERRKNLYSRVYYFLVAQGIEPNGCYQKRVMHSCRDYFKN
jgi:hypothetical protein